MSSNDSSRRIVLWFAPLAVAMTAFAADVSIKPGDQVIRVVVENADQLKQLDDWDLDIWTHELGIGPVEIHVSAAERKRFEDAGWPFTVVNPDLFRSDAEFMAANLMARGLATPFDSYLPLTDLWQFFDNLEAARPDLCSELPAIGNSIEGRPIRVWKITGSGADPKPGVFYHGLQHAREWITAPTVMYLANHLITNYDSDPCLADLVNRTEFYLAPCVNPDGYEYTWTTYRLWRKNRRNNGDGTFGVDLNRNWAYGWGGGGSSGTTSSETYRGTAPFSEPETTALSNFIISRPNIRAYMDYHSYSQLILWPYGNVCSAPPPPDDARFAYLGNTMQQLIEDVHGEYYEPGPICLTLYQASGGSVDWAYGSQGRTGFTIELRPASASPGFQLPPDQILPNCEENLPAILFLSRWASHGVLVELASSLPAQLIAGQPTSVTVSIINARETYVAGSGAMYYRFRATDPYTAVPLTPAGGSSHSAAIPAGPCGETAEFYFMASGSGGSSTTAPCNAPTTVYRVPIVGQTTLFADSFDTDRGWTSDIVGATSGQWERGVPVNDPNWAYDPPADADGNGWCFLTQNAFGNTDVDDGTVRLYSPTLDLTAPGLIIKYSYYLRLTDTTGGVDRLLVEANNAGGVGSWTQIALHTTDGGTAWRANQITQGDLVNAGVTPTTNMKLRFSANDANPQSIVEAGLDAFQVIVPGCPCPGPRGDMDGNGLIDAGDIQGLIDAMLAAPFYAACADLAAPFGTLDSADSDALVGLLLAP